MKCQNCGSEKSEDGHRCAHCGTHILPELCAVCFRHNPSGSRFCCSCGSRMVPPIPLHRSRPVKLCPVCVHPTQLEQYELGSVIVETCPVCHIQWLGWDDWKTIMRAAREHPPSDIPPKPLPSDDKPYLRCPVCRNLMHRGTPAPGYPRVDTCHQHGYWLEPGELEEAIRAASRPPKPRLTSHLPQMSPWEYD